jgi:LuxR family maltose regulon positive regulatory protein
MSASLLTTKLYVPPLRPSFVSRSRLVEWLDEGLRRGHRLTFVSAPAGYGKTTLVAEWLRGLRRPVAWLSLDESDSDPIRFLAYLVAALQQVDDAIGQGIQGALQSPQLPPVESLVTALINDIAAQPVAFVLVLDDYYLIGDLAVHEAVGFLLEHQPLQMHLVVVTREDPPLPLPRLRAQGQMTELRTSDLRFTAAEAAAFLNRAMGLNLAPEEVSALEAKTEGWIAGLQLAAVSLQKQTDRAEFIRRFAGDDRHVMDYLVDEVLSHQPEPVQHFLLQTSILERLCGPLCNAVTGRDDSQPILGHLERANLFVVPLDNRRYWYRYHHLFAELLRQRLGQSPSFIASEGEEERGGVETLHLRASRWYQREGFIAEAVSHALASSDPEHATDLIERYAAVIWDRGETALVHNWLEALPEGVVRSSPSLCIRRAWFAVVDSSEPMGSFVKVVERWLQDAERAWAARSSDADEPASSGFFSDVAAIRAFLSLRRGDDPKEVIEFARQALDCTPERAFGPRTALFFLLGNAYRALGNEHAALQAFADARKAGEAGGSLYAALLAVCNQVIMTCLRGQFRQAAEICRDALRSIAEPFEQAGRLLPAAGPIYILLGTILVEWGDLEEAERALSRGVELTKLVRAADPYIQRMGYESLIRLKWCQGDMAGALDLAEQLERPGSEGDSLAAAFRARIWLVQAEHDPRCLAVAARWAEERQIELDLDLEGQPSVEQLALARLLIAQHRARGQPDLQPLLQSLDRQLLAAEEGEHVWWVIEALILKAMALQAQGDTDRALSTLERALALAEPEGFVLLFVDEGAPMGRLLYEAVARGIAPDYAGRLLAAFSAAKPPPVGLPESQDIEAELVEPLSERELEVLGLIAEGLSNREIAQRLFISPRTVKRHTSSIYGKLCVHSRMQAVAKARTLGILSLDRP